MTEEQLQTMRDLLKVQGGMANLWLEPDLPDRFKELLTEVDRLRSIIRRAHNGDPDDLYEEAERLVAEQESKAS